MIANEKIKDMSVWPTKLKRLIFRRFKIDLDNRKTGFKDQPLTRIDEYHEDILDFAKTVYTAQQLEIDRVKSASTNLLTALSELQDTVTA